MRAHHIRPLGRLLTNFILAALLRVGARKKLFQPASYRSQHQEAVYDWNHHVRFERALFGDVQAFEGQSMRLQQPVAVDALRSLLKRMQSFRQKFLGMGLA